MSKFTKDTKTEKDIYKQIADELERGLINKGLYAKALAESGGNKEKTQANYIKLRFEELDSDLQKIRATEYETERNIKLKEQKQFVTKGKPMIFALIFWAMILSLIFSSL